MYFILVPLIIFGFGLLVIIPIILAFYLTPRWRKYHKPLLVGTLKATTWFVILNLGFRILAIGLMFLAIEVSREGGNHAGFGYWLDQAGNVLSLIGPSSALILSFDIGYSFAFRAIRKSRTE